MQQSFGTPLTKPLTKPLTTPLTTPHHNITTPTHLVQNHRQSLCPNNNPWSCHLAWWWIWSLNFAHAYVRCHHRPLPRIALRDRRVIFDIGLAAGVGGVSVKIRGDIWHEGIWFGFVLMLLSYNESARGVLLEGSRVLVTHLRDVTAVAWDGDIFAPWRVWLIKIAWRRSHHCCCCAD